MFIHEIKRNSIQSHTPFQPVRHLSSHLLQSNVFFPSLSFTALCASHIHLPKSSLELTRGAFPFSVIQLLKSSAHVQHGYSSENERTNVKALACCAGVGETGYCAVILCKSVHAERPSASTSGGQSGGGADEVCFLVRAAQEAKEVQDRQLHGC
jgi:hypothetical protein